MLLLGILVLAGKLTDNKIVLRIMQFGWIAPIAAIEFGWIVAEYGRQPWIVWGELKTVDAISLAVPAWQLLVTLALFLLVYTLIYVIWARSFIKTVKAGPSKYLEAAVATEAAPEKTAGEQAPQAAAATTADTEEVQE